MASVLEGNPEMSHPPLLLITYGNHCESQKFFSMQSRDCIDRNIPELRNKLVSPASYGYYLRLDTRTRDCTLWDPEFSPEFIQLPKVPRLGLYRCALSYSPDAKRSYVILVGPSSILFCRIGEKKFTERPKKVGDDFIMSVVNVEDKLYAWMAGKNARLVTLRFSSNWMFLDEVAGGGFPFRIPRWEYMYFDFQLISAPNKELWLVHMAWDFNDLDHWFQIFKIGLLEKGKAAAYEEMVGIPNQAILLSAFGGMAISSERTRIPENKICFIDTLFNYNDLYEYHYRNRGEIAFRLSRDLGHARALKGWIAEANH